MGLKAKVQNGRITLDEPTDLPEGTVLELVIDDEGDNLDEAEHRAIRAAISQSLDEEAAGLGIPAEEVLAELHKRNR